MVGVTGFVVSEQDTWMPTGLPTRMPDGAWDRNPIREAELGNAERLLPSPERQTLLDWWLKVPKGHTPNWDIASTCSVNGTRGLLLVEAKAHDIELKREASPKRLKADASKDGKLNHERIGSCIAGACKELSRETRLAWAISRDRNYQMSNRFAWACKLTELGCPVVLVYLGFLNADEMRDIGQPLATPDEWAQVVRAHSQRLVPPEAWNQVWTVHGQPLIPLIRSIRVNLPVARQ